MVDILVIGYGNVLRGDDGLGPLVAKAVATANIPGVRILSARQLLPEFTVDLAQAKRVIFVDASEVWNESGIEVRFLAVENATDWCTHRADPRTLLALTQAIWGQAPEAWLLTVSGRNFELGEKLSDMAEENMRQALVCLKRLIQAKTSYGPGSLPHHV